MLARHNGIYVVYNPDWIFDMIFAGFVDLLIFFMFPYRFVRVTTVRLLVTRPMHLPVSLLVRAKCLGSDFEYSNEFD